jgi:hypothetical protein
LNDANIIDELVAAQERLQNEAWLPDFLFATDTIVVTTETVDLETELDRYLRLHDRAGGIRYLDSSATDNEPYKKLTRFDEKELLVQRYPGNLTAGNVPQGYFMVDSLVVLRPVPSAGASVTLHVSFYQGEAVDPAAGNSTLWTIKAADYLMGEAGIAIAQFLRDQQALSLFQATLGRGKSMLTKKSFGDEQADQDYQMGDRD